MDRKQADIDEVTPLVTAPVEVSADTDSLSMHANVPVWCDCCSCEAEPYWLEALAAPDDSESG